jgi:hypothetical protein
MVITYHSRSVLPIGSDLNFQNSPEWVKNSKKICFNLGKHPSLAPASWYREAAPALTPHYFSWYVVLGSKHETFILYSSNHSTLKSLMSIYIDGQRAVPARHGPTSCRAGPMGVVPWRAVVPHGSCRCGLRVWPSA